MSDVLLDLLLTSGALAVVGWICVHATQPFFESKASRVVSQTAASALLFVSFVLSKAMGNASGASQDDLVTFFVVFLSVKAVAMYLIGCYAKSVGKSPYWSFIGLLNFGLALIFMATKLWRTQGITPSGPSNSQGGDEDLYLEASEEFSSSSRQAGLWAKMLALHDGDEEKAKFSYIRERVAQKQSVSSVPVEAKNSTPELSVPQAETSSSGGESIELFGEQGETYKFPNLTAASEFSAKFGVKLSPAQQPEAEIANAATAYTMPTEGLSLEERSSRLDAALKAAAARKG